MIMGFPVFPADFSSLQTVFSLQKILALRSEVLGLQMLKKQLTNSHKSVAWNSKKKVSYGGGLVLAFWHFGILLRCFIGIFAALFCLRFWFGILEAMFQVGVLFKRGLLLGTPRYISQMHPFCKPRSSEKTRDWQPWGS